MGTSRRHRLIRPGAARRVSRASTALRRVPARGRLRLSGGVLGVLMAMVTAAGLPPTAAIGVAPAPSAVGGSPAARTAVGPAATVDAARIELAGVEPPVATPGGRVTISGTVRAGAAPLGAVTVRAIRGRPTLSLRSDVTSWAASTSTDGIELARTEVAGPIPAGAAAGFAVSVDAAALALPRTHGAVPLALEVFGGSARSVLHTFVGWNRSTQYEPLRVAWLAPLVLDATADLSSPDPTTRLGAWTRWAAADGRLSRIVDGTAGAPVAWALDPAIFGPDRRTPAQVDADPITAVVAPLATRVAVGAAGRTILALPYADPDVTAADATAATTTPMRELARRGVAATAWLGPTVVPGVLWPADGGLPDGREQVLRTIDPAGTPTAVLASSSSLPFDRSQTTTAAKAGPLGTPLLAWDDRLSLLPTRTRTTADGILAAQEFVAESAMVSLERPGQPGRTVLVALPRDLDPDPAALRRFFASVSSVPWLTPRDLRALLGDARAAGPVSRTSAGGWSGGGTPALDPLGIAWIEAQRTTLTSQAGAIADGGAFAVQWQDTLDQLTSTRWRSHTGARDRLRSDVEQATARIGTAIQVQPQTTNFLADEGALRITVVNDLPDAVDGLRLHLAPANPRLRIEEPTQPIRIEARSRATVQVSARAVAAGLVPVTAWLTGPDGARLGQEATITIRANPPGIWLYVGGGAVLALLLAVGVMRALRRAPPPPPPGSEEIDPVIAVPDGSNRTSPLG